MATDFIQTVVARLVALGGSVERVPEDQDGAPLPDARHDPRGYAGAVLTVLFEAERPQPYGGSSKLAATFHEAGAEPRCSAHGAIKCEWCSRNGGRQTCDECIAYEATGMHWDTCPNRVR